ncbi:30S ribosomal protein S9 [Candidatus Altiarchaeota archaeon]
MQFDRRQMMAAKKIAHMSGKRKKSVARTTIKPGNGTIRINSVVLDEYSSNVARYKIKTVLLIVQDYVDLGKINISCEVYGGGVMGQADAVACSLARGFIEYTGDSDLQATFYKHDRTLIAGDHRLTETHKPSQSSKGPRHKRQKSYR